jgi:hypothetical protein
LSVQSSTAYSTALQARTTTRTLAGATKILDGEAAAVGTTTMVTTTHLLHIRRAHREERLLRHLAADLRLHRNGSLAFGVERPLELQPELPQATQQAVDPHVRHDNLLVVRIGSAAVAAASRRSVGVIWRDQAVVGMSRPVLVARGGVETPDERLRSLT